MPLPRGGDGKGGARARGKGSGGEGNPPATVPGDSAESADPPSVCRFGRSDSDCGNLNSPHTAAVHAAWTVLSPSIEEEGEWVSL